MPSANGLPVEVGHLASCPRVEVNFTADPQSVIAIDDGADSSRSWLVRSRHRPLSHGPQQDPDSIIEDYLDQ